MSRGWRFALSIRAKALLLLPLVLAIPYVGYQYVREMEDFLRLGLEDALIATARALASGLHDQPALFMPSDAAASGEGIYAHPLPAPIEIDGYTPDWASHLSGLQELPRAEPSDDDPAPTAHYVVGKRGDYLYLLFLIDDDDVVYREPQANLPKRSDHVRLVIATPDAEKRAFALSTISPGWVTAYEISRRTSNPPVKIEVRIRAEWQPTSGGYALEVRLPLSMIGARIGFDVVDYDRSDPPSTRRKLPKPKSLILPSEQIEELINRLGRLSGRRVWVLDRFHRVLARGGSLERDQPITPINPLYVLLLRPPSTEVFREPPVVSELRGAEIDAALSGNIQARWRASSQENVWIVSAAYPVRSRDNIVGAVVVEESSLGIQTVTREALANLFNKTLLVSLIGALALLLFASRIGLRLHRLRNEAEAAIDEHGRVTGTLSRRHGSDEIGDLSMSMAAMMERLRQYNQYLENLARRLSHELRTPLAIVRSSLDSLGLDPSKESADLYGARAQEGVTRLDAILTRMSEASRLEQAMQSADKQRFDLCPVIAATIEAYRATWPEQGFEFPDAERSAYISGNPDLVVQMTDKLVSNAVDLGAPDQPIKIRLDSLVDRHVLKVSNQGSRLPEAMQGKLFESMVSMRDPHDGTDPHLGLGLYIARLVAEFHDAKISARNLDSERGVEVAVSFPSG